MPTITDRTRKRLSQKQLRNQCRGSRRQQARKARASRRQIDRIHDQLPKQVRTIFDPVEPAFTHPTHHRFVLLALAAILTLRGRTIANLLRCLGSLAPETPAVITASSPATAGPLGRWHVVLPRRSSPGLYPRAPSNWLATTPSRSTPARTFTARVAIATRSVPLASSPPTAGGTSGSP